MIELQGPPAEIRFTITVKRAATGKEETYEMVGYTQPQEQEQEHGSNPLDSSAQRSD